MHSGNIPQLLVVFFLFYIFIFRANDLTKVRVKEWDFYEEWLFVNWHFYIYCLICLCTYRNSPQQPDGAVEPLRPETRSFQVTVDSLSCQRTSRQLPLSLCMWLAVYATLYGTRGLVTPPHYPPDPPTFLQTEEEQSPFTFCCTCGLDDSSSGPCLSGESSGCHSHHHR